MTKEIKLFHRNSLIKMKNTHQVPLRFDESFFYDYAGNLILDPHVAIIELVAELLGCWSENRKNNLARKRTRVF